jgi:exodeoxyribonuclease VII small subunit
MTAVPPKKDQQTFEELYQRLEETVAKLEAGGLSLEDALAIYEEGMNLARRCQEILDGAELKVTRLKEAFAAYTAPPEPEEPEESGEEPC